MKSLSTPIRASLAGLVAGGALAFGVLTMTGGADNASSPVDASPVTAAATTSDSASAQNAALQALSIAEVYQKARNAVVEITTNSGLGSGFLVDGDGHIVTNQHVVGNATDVTVKFADGSQVSGKVLGTDSGTDLAVVEAQVPDSVQPLDLADSATVQVGDVAIAIGNPFGLDGTLTAGVISATGRAIQTETGRTVTDAIQTDASINSGNSGGPLLNADGQVIGVNSQLENPTGQGNIGIGFAISSNTLKRFLPSLVAGQDVQHAYLGISGTEVDQRLADQYSLSATSGLLVTSVVAGGPADSAGLRAATRSGGGDVIVAIDGQQVVTFEDLNNIISSKSPGDTVDLTVQRGDQQVHVTVTLGTWPENQRQQSDQPFPTFP